MKFEVYAVFEESYEPTIWISMGQTPCIDEALCWAGIPRDEVEEKYSYQNGAIKYMDSHVNVIMPINEVNKE